MTSTAELNSTAACSSGSAGRRQTSFSTKLSPRRYPATLSPPSWPSRMPRETGTQFKVWIDHLVSAGDRALAERLAELGYERQRVDLCGGRAALRAFGRDLSADCACASTTPSSSAALDSSVAEVAIKVESVPAFSRAHDLGLEVAGYPMGPYRVAGSRASGRRWPWSSAGAIADSSPFPASWRTRDG